MQGVGSGAIVEGIQRCFCMDIQRSERDSIRANTTQNWVGHYYTIDASGQVQIRTMLQWSNKI